MKRTDQARILAEFLVPLLPNLCNTSSRSQCWLLIIKQWSTPPSWKSLSPPGPQPKVFTSRPAGPLTPSVQAQAATNAAGPLGRSLSKLRGTRRYWTAHGGPAGLGRKRGNP